MLLELLKKEIENNFDTSRYRIEMKFDGRDAWYQVDKCLFAKYALEQNKSNAKIYIRDNTQSFIYYYDFANNSLTRSDENVDKWHKPLLEKDDGREEYEKEIKNKRMYLNKNLLLFFLFGSLPFLISMIFLFLYNTNENIRIVFSESPMGDMKIMIRIAVFIELFLIYLIIKRKSTFESEHE